MNKEKLDSLLSSGAITQEEYSEMLSKLGGNENGLQEKGQEETKAEEAQFTNDDIKKLIQSEVDKVRTKYSLELKNKEQELKKIRAEHLTKEEVAKLEIEEAKKELEAEKAAFKLEKTKNFAKDELVKANLCKKPDLVLKLTDFIKGDNEEEVATQVKTLAEVILEIAKENTEERFKSNGRTPNTGSSNGGNNNPFSKDSWNLTRQMQLMTENPELAKQLQATAK